mgnify:CR=1 FL=1
MAISRYVLSRIVNNDDRDYKKLYLERYGNKNFLRMLDTLELDYPTFAEAKNFNYITHVWSMGDRYYKLADKHYGSSEYWWIIAFFNKRPTEFHIEAGDLIRVPQPLTDVLDSLGF